MTETVAITELGILVDTYLAMLHYDDTIIELAGPDADVAVETEVSRHLLDVARDNLVNYIKWNCEKPTTEVINLGGVWLYNRKGYVTMREERDRFVARHQRKE